MSARGGEAGLANRFLNVMSLSVVCTGIHNVHHCSCLSSVLVFMWWSAVDLNWTLYAAVSLHYDVMVLFTLIWLLMSVPWGILIQMRTVWICLMMCIWCANCLSFFHACCGYKHHWLLHFHALFTGMPFFPLFLAGSVLLFHLSFSELSVSFCVHFLWLWDGMHT